MRARNIVVLSAAFFATTAVTVIAQEPLAFAPGARIRFTLVSPIEPVSGEVLVQRGDSLWVRPFDRSPILAINLRDIARLERSVSRHSYTMRGAGIGLLAGGTMGAVLSHCEYSGSCSTNRLKGAAFAGSLGAGIGAIIGTAFKTERWKPVVVTTIGERSRAYRAPASSAWIGLRHAIR